jgi:hypothetical protein
MYTKATSLPNLYIRNIVPDDTIIPLPSTWPYRGGAKRPFSTYVEEEFCELRLNGVLRSSHLAPVDGIMLIGGKLGPH